MTVRYVTPRVDQYLTTPAAAIDLVGRLADPDHADSLTVVFLDARRRVLAALLVDALPVADSTVEIVRHLMHGFGGRPDPLEFEGLVLATRRAVLDQAHLEADLDRWSELDACCAENGFELIEWIVMSADRVVLPRERLGRPHRWPVDSPA